MATRMRRAGLAAVLCGLSGGFHGASAQVPQTTPDSSGPQTAVPAPATGGRADVSGGSARNGIVRPPQTASTMPVIRPPATGRTPVLPPSATTGPQVQPK